ncbi:MAG: hypothetical protein WBC03_09015, partial [Albidovulum sp.]
AATSSQDEQRLIDRVLSLPMPNGFGAAFLRAKGLAWAAEVIETVPVSGVVAPAAAMPSPILATPNQPPHPQPPPIPPVIPKRIIPPMHPLLNSTAVNAVLPPIPTDPAFTAERLTPFRANASKPKRTRP